MFMLPRMSLSSQRDLYNTSQKLKIESYLIVSNIACYPFISDQKATSQAMSLLFKLVDPSVE